MALTYSWPGPTGLATTTDGRKALAGLIVKDTAGVARHGVFPAHDGAIVSARTDLNVDIGAFQAAAVQFGGPILLTNDGAAQLPSALTSPVSGTNWYVVYAKQNESTSPGTDGDDTVEFGAVVSTSSFANARTSGSRLDASGTGLPTGALELATVQLPTGKSATNAEGVTITQTFQYTAAAGGTVWLRNSTEAAAWSPEDGSTAYRIDLGQHYTRSDGGWRAQAFAMEQGTVDCPGTGSTGGGFGYSDLIDVTFTAGRFTAPPQVKVATVGPADQAVFAGMAEQVTTSGCKVRAYRVGAVPSDVFGVEWTAIQMTSGSADG